MANIVELRGLSDDKIAEMLEEARGEMFNLRFQQAMTRLDDPSQLKRVQREIAQFETVLHMRGLATNAATQQPEIAKALSGVDWHADTRFDYEESAWVVQFVDKDGKNVAQAHVDLNVAQPKGTRRQRGRARNRVLKYEVVG
ncbi:MAG TPA: 50S ribosomal protein L29 [Anaerolineae bacterium]|nr:50S ribosomal protein L29 [Anaerolineae bacterium]